MKMLYPSELDIKWFNRKFVVDNLSGCWNWTAGKFDRRYGQYHYNNYPVLAHRFAYLLKDPNFDQSLCVCHKCDNPLCVNPEHLFLGTSAENTQDKCDKNRQVKGELNGTSILSELQVKDILTKYSTGQFSQRKLGRMFKVSQTLIHYIVTRKNWSHVTV